MCCICTLQTWSQTQFTIFVPLWRVQAPRTYRLKGYCLSESQQKWHMYGLDDGCQVVALVFEHVDIEHSKQATLCMATPRSPGSPGSRSAKSQAGSDTLHSPGSGALIEHGPANAALKLLDNLCMMLTGVLHLLLRALQFTGVRRPS